MDQSAVYLILIPSNTSEYRKVVTILCAAANNASISTRMIVRLIALWSEANRDQ
jgi:hypothetical protein